MEGRRLLGALDHVRGAVGGVEPPHTPGERAYGLHDISTGERVQSGDRRSKLKPWFSERTPLSTSPREKNSLMTAGSPSSSRRVLGASLRSMTTRVRKHRFSGQSRKLSGGPANVQDGSTFELRGRDLPTGREKARRRMGMSSSWTILHPLRPNWPPFSISERHCKR